MELRQLQFFLEPQHEIFGLPGGSDDPVSDSFLQFGFSCAGFLRDREVLLHSNRAADSDCATNPNQFPGLGVQDLFVLVIQNLLADPHCLPPLITEE
jgi:hypothetical protein